MREELIKYWEQMAIQFHWFRPWVSIFKEGKPGGLWFKGGETNITYNALDVHVNSPKRNKVALIWESEDGRRIRFTYFDLWREVMRFSNVLKNFGVKKRDPIVIYMPNLPEAIVALLAVARIGAVHVPVDIRYGPFVLRKIIHETGSKVLITANGYYRKGNAIWLKPRIEAALSACDIDFVIMVKRLKEEEVRESFFWYHELMEGQKTESDPAEVEANEPLGILYTPNHKGRMVGITYPHGGYMVGVAKSMKEVFGLRETDVVWWASELGNIIGQSYMVYGPLLNGSTTVLYEGHLLYPGPERTWSIIHKYGVTLFGAYPSRLRVLMPYGEKPVRWLDISTLRHLYLSGEALDEPLTHWLQETVTKRANIVNLWITAETGVFSLMAKGNRLGNSYTPLPFLQKVFPVFNPVVVTVEGNTLPPDQKGILGFSEPLPSMFANVWNDERAFLEYWAPNGIFLSKDFAIKDKKGLIKLSGHRSSRVINIGGLIVPAELIELAMKRHSAVIEATARAMPDSIKGQVAEVEIRVKEGIERTHDLRSELLQFAKTELGPGVIIRQITFERH